MRNVKTIAAIAGSLALCFALSGCGGNAASSGAASAASSEGLSASGSGVSVVDADEVAIKTDFRLKVAMANSPVVLASAFSQDPDTVAVLDVIGLDVREYAELLCNLIIFEPKNVVVNGDKAVLTVEMTAPDFVAAEAVMDKALAEKTQGQSPDAFTTEERADMLKEVLRDTLQYPTMPSTTSSFDVEYVKVDGTWNVADESKLQEALANAMEGA